MISKMFHLLPKIFWIMQIIALLLIDKRLVNTKIDFLISGSKHKHYLSQTFHWHYFDDRDLIFCNIRYTLLYATLRFDNVAVIYWVQK